MRLPGRWLLLPLAIPLVLGLLTARNRGVDLRASLLALRSDLATREPPPTGPVPQPVPAQRTGGEGA